MKKVLLYLLVAGFIVACSSNEGEKPKQNKTDFKQKMADKFGISLFELENGIGPVKEKLNLGAIDDAKVEAGEKTFTAKCVQCHKLDEKFTGPALRDVTKRRSPEYILNMIMNPQEMTKKHPEARKLKGLFAAQMTYQNVTLDDAKNILDYLRKSAN
jgi:mono/diheme cytochrome c family protein